jgi:hypothetical protein
VLHQKKETKDKAVEQLWTALAGPEGIKAKLLQKATPGSLDSACAEQL